MDAFASEIEDARQILKKLHKIPEGFKFEIKRHDIKGPDGAYAVRATIRVTCQGRSIDFEAGHGLSWLEQFEIEVRAGWRGAPGFIKEPKA